MNLRPGKVMYQLGLARWFAHTADKLVLAFGWDLG